MLAESKFTSNVVLCNRKVGDMEATLLYDELDEKQYRRSTRDEEEKQKRKRAQSKLIKRKTVLDRFKKMI